MSSHPRNRFIAAIRAYRHSCNVKTRGLWYQIAFLADQERHKLGDLLPPTVVFQAADVAHV